MSENDGTCEPAADSDPQCAIQCDRDGSLFNLSAHVLERSELLRSMPDAGILAVPFSRQEVQSWVSFMHTTAESTFSECAAALRVADFLQDAVTTEAAAKAFQRLLLPMRISKDPPTPYPVPLVAVDILQSLTPEIAELVFRMDTQNTPKEPGAEDSNTPHSHAPSALLWWTRVLPEACLPIAITGLAHSTSHTDYYLNLEMELPTAGRLQWRAVDLDKVCRALKALSSRPLGLTLTYLPGRWSPTPDYPPNDDTVDDLNGVDYTSQLLESLSSLRELQLVSVRSPEPPPPLPLLTRLRMIHTHWYATDSFMPDIGKLTTLKELDIEKPILSHDSEDLLLKQLPCLPHLTSLSISYGRISVRQAGVLRKALQDCTPVQSLTLPRVGNTTSAHDCMEMLLYALPNMPNLTELNLPGFCHPIDLANILGELQDLKSLNLYGSCQGMFSGFEWSFPGFSADIFNEQYKALLESFGVLSGLQKFSFWRGGFYAFDWQPSYTARAVQALPRSITSLQLDAYQMGMPNGDPYHDVLPQICALSLLRELKLESCEEFTKHSVQQFIALNELRTLSVRNCYMKSEVMTELLAALPKQLTALDVFGNCFSAPVATELEKQIRLRRLSVGARHECWKCFATEACNALVRVVRTLKDLWEFQVDTDCMETVSASRKLEMELKCALQRKPHIRSTLMRLDVRTLTHTKRRRLKPF